MRRDKPRAVTLVWPLHQCGTVGSGVEAGGPTADEPIKTGNTGRVEGNPGRRARCGDCVEVQGLGGPEAYSPGVAVLLLLLCVGLLIFAATRYDWALVAFAGLVIGALALGIWVNSMGQGWDGL